MILLEILVEFKYVGKGLFLSCTVRYLIFLLWLFTSCEFSMRFVIKYVTFSYSWILLFHRIVCLVFDAAERFF